MDDTKLHWFCFSYTGKEIETGDDVQASTYTGYSTKNITLPIIDENKKNAHVTDAAVLLSVSYLGYMTRAELLGD